MKHSRRCAALLVPSLIFCGSVGRGGEVLDITYTNSGDATEQKAELFIPSAHDGKRKLPLLLFCHYMNGNRQAARGVGHHESAERLGWYVVSPELHGLHSDGKTSFGAIPAQHDAVDAIRWVQDHYPVDETRIYADGRSMGGLQALLLAAKYPHLFAAAMSGQPPTDLTSGDEPGEPFFEVLSKEIGGTRTEQPFEYARREPVTFARNFRYVPTMLWHGTLDRVVPPEHSERLYQLIRKYHVYQTPVFWLDGAGHNPINYGSEWICEKLRWYQKTKDRFYPDLDFVRDESGPFFWITLEQADPLALSSVSTELRDGVMTLRCLQVKRLSLDMAPFGPQRPKQITVACEAPLSIEVKGVPSGTFRSEITNGESIPLP